MAGNGVADPGLRRSVPESGFPMTDDEKPTQFEQENDLGQGGGEVDDDTLSGAHRTAEERRSTANAEDDSGSTPGSPAAPR
jgi:hypothetical protein